MTLPHAATSPNRLAPRLPGQNISQKHIAQTVRPQGATLGGLYDSVVRTIGAPNTQVA
jgi:hypothetical protein